MIDKIQPGIDLVPVTLSDTVNLPTVARSLRFTAGGTVVFTTHTDNIRTTIVQAFDILPVKAKRVWSTGTTVPQANVEAII